METKHYPTPLAAELAARNLSQIEFARQIGFSESQVNRWSTGRTTPIRVHRELIARKLKISEEQLWPTL
jgi:transcriptional regulator with XRE-family HTH domain